jgi:glycosyltransferase involved in cell wall biosynthesis
MPESDYTLASYCSSPSWGGLEMNVLRFLSWMQQRGWRVRLYGDPETQMYRKADSFEVPASPVTSGSFAADPLNGWRLSRALKRDNVRWLTVHQSHDLLLTSLARKFSRGRIRLVYHQHMHIGGDKKDPYHRWLYNQLDAFISPVEWLAERVKEKTGIDHDRIHIIPRGVVLERYVENQPERQAARERYQVPQDAFIIGLVGRLDPKKGQHVLIDALARLHKKGYRPHLLLVGSQTYNEAEKYVVSVYDQVMRLGLSDYVHFRPHEVSPEWAYAALDIFVLASKSECYGMVTVEAMCSGLPVVGTNDGGTVSLIDHGRNGLLVTPMDPDDLAKALELLIGDRETAARLGKTAREEAIKRYSHTRQCEVWERVLRGLR